MTNPTLTTVPFFPPLDSISKLRSTTEKRFYIGKDGRLVEYYRNTYEFEVKPGKVEKS